MNRLVIDPSVLLASLTGHPEGAPATLRNAVQSGTIEAIACPMLMTEVRDGLRKPYFRARYTETDAGRAIARLQASMTVLSDPVSPEPVLVDADDDYLVALAREASASIIVSLDNHLLNHTGLVPPAITPLDICELLWLIQPTNT